MGRPKKPIDERRVKDLAAKGASTNEIGEILGVDDQTIHRRFAKVLAKERAERRVKLRVAQWKRAMAGNAALLIFLGKNLLDQTDKPPPDAGPGQPTAFVLRGPGAQPDGDGSSV